jgi:hypothetical protein
MFVNLRFYIIYLALFAGILGIIYLYKLPTIKAKSIVLMIWFSILTEFVGIHFTQWTNQLNYIVFNVYIIVSLSYIMVLLRKLLFSIKYKKIAVFFLVVFWLFFLINHLWYYDDFNKIDSKSFALGIIFIVILSCRYLFEIVNSNKILDFQYSLFFWFVIGVLLFHVPFLPFMLSEHFFLIDYDQNVTSLILFFLNLLMYCCFIIGFIWSEKKYNY